MTDAELFTGETKRIYIHNHLGLYEEFSPRDVVFLQMTMSRIGPTNIRYQLKHSPWLTTGGSEVEDGWLGFVGDDQLYAIGRWQILSLSDISDWTTRVTLSSSLDED